MRIAFVTFEYPPFIMGGAEIYATNITRELAKLGHQVIVFTPQINDLEEKKDEFNNLEIERMRMNKRLPFKALQFWLHLSSAVKKAGNKSSSDIIHFNGISYWFFKNKILKAPHVITVHHLVKDALKNNNMSLICRFQDISGENNLFMSFIEKMCMKFEDMVITVSNFTKNQIIKTYNVTSAKIEVIHNGIDLLVDAFSDLVNELDGVVLIIAGQDDGFLVMLKERIADLKITDKNLFTGPLYAQDKLEAYIAPDVYVLPSIYETFPVTVLETCACGTPVFFTDHCGFADFVDGKIDHMVEYDKVLLGDAIFKVLSDGELMRNFGERGRKLVGGYFSWDTTIKTIEGLYGDCIRDAVK